MAVINVAPIILRDVLLRFTGVGSPSGTGDFEKHVSQVEFIPASSPVTWKGLSPSANFTFPTTATWTCTLSYAQDWETLDSLSQFLHDAEGQEIECMFEPVKGGATWTAMLLITPGAIGGTVDAVAVATVTLGVNGKPSRELVAPVITTETLAAMTEAEPTHQAIAATGSSPITWAVTAGTLPAGLGLTTSGVLYGAPAAGGSYDFTVTATNTAGDDTQQFTGSVASAE